MAYWCAAQLEPNRERIARLLLAQEHFTVYAPRLRMRRIVRGRREDHETSLFPGYLFVWIELQWHRARWCPGIRKLVMDGLQPAKVPDAVIEDIKSRERNGAIELGKRPRFWRGAQVRVTCGLFQGRVAIFDDMTGPERARVLLQLLGSYQRTELSVADIEPIEVAHHERGQSG